MNIKYWSDKHYLYVSLLNWKHIGPSKKNNQSLLQELMRANHHLYVLLTKIFCFSSVLFRSEIIPVVDIGFSQKTKLMDTKLWSEDFTETSNGICYTLQIGRRLTPDYTSDQLFLHLSQSYSYLIFLHDPDYFVLNTNPRSTPGVQLKLSTTKLTSIYYDVEMVRHKKLNLPLQPCEEDDKYNFNNCIKDFLSNKVILNRGLNFVH